MWIIKAEAKTFGRGRKVLASAFYYINENSYFKCSDIKSSIAYHLLDK